MLQTNLGGIPLQMAIFNPPVSTDSKTEGSKSAQYKPVLAPCTTTSQLLNLFEEITGWKAEFAESNCSLQRRKSSSSKSEPVQGAFSIVDMSEDWPIQKPTCHRGKCDQFIDLIDQLVGKLYLTQVELGRAQSALVALDPVAEIEDDELVDSFVHKLRPEPKPETDQVVIDEFAEFDDDFEVFQQVSDSAGSLVCPPFDGWSLGGSTGIVGNYYLNWMVDNDEHISICAGEVETMGLDKRESVILIDPLTNEYRVVPGECEQDRVPQRQTFQLWDLKSFSFSVINPSTDWHRLESHQAIIATTSNDVSKIKCWRSALKNHFEQTTEFVPKAGSSSTAAIETNPIKTSATNSVSTNQLADVLIKTLGTSDPLLVLKRD